MILTCNNINKSYGENVILKDISFNINEREKVALVGVNGTGKTTLLKIISGEVSKDFGEVFLAKNTRLGYFSQNLNLNEENTPIAELLPIFDEIIKKEEKLKELEIEMQKTNEDEMKNLIEEYTKTLDYLNENNCFGYENKIKGVLKGLGFSKEQFNLKIGSLSGGQKTRVALAKILLKEPDLLLLDEPTNHLDIQSIQWLENFLNGYKGTVLIISHDRYFLDKIVSKVIEIENKKSRVYLGNYTEFSIKKQKLREDMLKKYLLQEKEIKRQEEVIKKLKSYGREKFIKRAESREKLLDKMEKVEKVENLPNTMRLVITPKKQSGKDVLTIDNLEKSFEKKIFENISFEVKKGEKIALIGHNGVGKSTLIKMILEKTEISGGSIKLGSNVVIGYYDQEQKTLNENKTILEEVLDTYPNLKNEEIRKTLAIFLFMEDDINKKISSLSGGEKGRISLAKIMLSNANLLILDEPTNHLDINSKEILENAISNYEGTCIYISHDRFFINNTATKILELKSNKIETYLGNYDYYLEKSINNLDIPNKEIPKTEKDTDWKNQKEIKALNRKIERQREKLEDEINQLENKVEELKKTLELEEVYTNFQKSNEILIEKTNLENLLLDKYEQWEALA